MNNHTSNEINLQQKSRQMEISFADGKRFELWRQYVRRRMQATGASRKPGLTPAAAPVSGRH